jgi:hypothetical protein
MIELVLLVAIVIPLCWWQLWDVSKAQKESARKREERARGNLESGANNDASQSGSDIA